MHRRLLNMDHASFFTEATFVEMLRSRRAESKPAVKKKKIEQSELKETAAYFTANSTQRVNQERVDEDMVLVTCNAYSCKWQRQE